MSQGILYISYDGMLEPLGQSQVLAYLERLALGRRIHLISFEKANDWADRARRQRVAERIAAAGIRWHPLRYHKRPSAAATAYDIATGSAVAVAIARRDRIGIVHARSYVPGLMALAVKRATGARFLFDMRGFWADERVDGGLWPANGRLYRAAKGVERRLLLAADHVVTLTHASEAELRAWSYLRQRAPPITVIPTCTDLDRFRIQGPPQLEPFVLGYVGSVGTWYLLDEMLRCFVLFRRELPDSRLLIVNRGENALIRARIQKLGIDEAAAELVAADHSDVPRLIAGMSAALAFYAPSFSRLACSPTKIGEYLGSGVPILASAGVGDVNGLVERERVGAVVSGFSDEELRSGLSQLLNLLAEPERLQKRCREVAENEFSLDRGAQAYAAIYDQLASSPCEQR
jgi:glycosyltransferase involved in cell wall biosynthesis